MEWYHSLLLMLMLTLKTVLFITTMLFTKNVYSDAAKKYGSVGTNQYALSLNLV